MVRAFPQMLQISHQVMPKSIVLEVQTGGGVGGSQKSSTNKHKDDTAIYKTSFFYGRKLDSKWTVRKSGRRNERKIRKKERIKAYYGVISAVITLRTNCNM